MRLLSVTVVLGILSVGQSAPLHQSCDSLIRPLENPRIDKMVGKWIKIGESVGNSMLMTVLKKQESAWVDVSAGQNTSLNIHELTKLNGRCISYNYSAIFENGSLHTEIPIAFSAQMLHTDSSDCNLMHLKVALGRIYLSSLQLSCKRMNVPLEELNIFKQQVECLKLPPPLMLKPDADLCPDPNSEHQGIEVTNLNSHLTEEKIEELKGFIDSGGMADILEKHTNSSIIPFNESA